MGGDIQSLMEEIRHLRERVESLEDAASHTHDSHDEEMPITAQPVELPDSPDMPIIAKLGAVGTGAYAGMYAWQEAGMNANAPVVLTSGGYTVAASQPGSAIQLPPGYTILFPFHNAKAQFVMLPQGTFPVLLTYGSSPGADGSATAAATWAYTFYDVSDPGLTTPKGTNQQPAPPRPLGSMTRQPASVANTSYSYGLACNGVAGAVILLTAYEQPNKGTC